MVFVKCLVTFTIVIQVQQRLFDLKSKFYLSNSLVFLNFEFKLWLMFAKIKMMIIKSSYHFFSFKKFKIIYNYYQLSYYNNIFW